MWPGNPASSVCNTLQELNSLVHNTEKHIIDKFKEYVQTTSFWANGWAISVLEYELKVKLILLSERAYLDEDEFNVLLCGEVEVSGNILTNLCSLLVSVNFSYSILKRLLKLFLKPSLSSKIK